jgi:hypothetical protein
VVISFYSHDTMWGKSYRTVEEGFSKWTVYKFSNVLMKNTCNVGIMKNSGKVYLFLQELLEWQFRITLDIYRTTFALFIDAVPLRIAACKPPAYWCNTVHLQLVSYRFCHFCTIYNTMYEYWRRFMITLNAKWRKLRYCKRIINHWLRNTTGVLKDTKS